MREPCAVCPSACGGAAPLGGERPSGGRAPEEGAREGVKDEVEMAAPPVFGATVPSTRPGPCDEGDV